MKVRVLWGVAGVWLVASVAGCAQSNPLLGRWVLSSGDVGCNQVMVFGPKTQSFTWRGSTSSAPVTGYVVEKGKVVVGGSPGVIETFSYEFIDATTIHQPNMNGKCVWKKQ